MIDIDNEDGNEIKSLYRLFSENSSYELEFRLKTEDALRISKYEEIIDKNYKLFSEEIRDVINYDNKIREVKINGNIQFQRKIQIQKYDIKYLFFTLRLSLSNEESVSSKNNGKLEQTRRIHRKIYKANNFDIHISNILTTKRGKITEEKELEFELHRNIKLLDMIRELSRFIMSIYPGIPIIVKEERIEKILDMLENYNPPLNKWRKSYPQLRDITRNDIKNGILDSASVSNKLDGERMIIVSCSLGTFAIVPSGAIKSEYSFICMNLLKEQKNNEIFILLDSEYNPNDYKFYIFDIYQFEEQQYYNNNIFHIPFSERYNLIDSALNKIEIKNKDKLIKKPFQICSNMKCNVYVETLLTLKSMFEEYKTLENIKKYNDGIVNQLELERDSKKYKFPENLTIDFEIKIKSSSSKDCGVIVDLLVPISDDRKESFLLMEDVNKNYPCINDDKWSDIKNGDVIEFGYDENDFYPIRYRRDKTTGNFYKVALAIWKQIMNPIYLNEYLLLLKEKYPLRENNDKKLEQEILEKIKEEKMETKGAKCLAEMRKYHNQIKIDLLNKNVNKTTSNYSIFDIGSGKGGDLGKFWLEDNKLTKLYLLEPFSEHLNGKGGLYDRIKQMINRNYTFKNRIENGTKVIPLGLSDVDSYNNIMEELNGEKFNFITSFFSLTFFFKSEELLDLLVKFIDNSLMMNGLFIGTCTDGEKLGKYIIQEMKKGEVTLGSCISIIPDFKKLSYECGDKIQIKLNTATVADYQTEYLIYFDKLIDKLKQKNIKLITDKFFNPNLKDKSEQLYSSFHRLFIFKKEKEKRKTFPLIHPYLESGSIEVFETIYSANYTFVRIGTIAEGSCFFHSIYENIDPKYRKLSNRKKKEFIIKKREELVDTITLDEFLYYGDYLINNLLIYLNEKIEEKEEKLVIPTIYPIMNIKQKLEILSSYMEEKHVLSREDIDEFINNEYEKFRDKLKDCSEWISYDVLSFIQRKLNINFIIITDQYRDIYQTANKYNYENPFLLILNLNNTHYEAIGLLYENPKYSEDNKKYLLERIFNISDPVIRQLLGINEVKKMISSHNMFYYLNKFKDNIIDIVSSHTNIKRSSIEGMFIKWYLNSVTYGSYIPNILKIRRDLEFQSKREEKKGKKEKINIDNIINLVNEQVKILNEKVSNVNNKYVYKNVFSNIQKELLKKKYTGNKEEFDQHRNFLSELYNFMRGFNNHLSVPPLLIDNDWIELFGTSVNTKNRYCSPFKIEKDYFGSYGSFFDFEIKAGTYIANPPFDEEIIERMANRLIEQLGNKKDKINIIVIIPNWNDLTGYDLLVESKYVISDNIIPKDFKFYNYYDNLLHPVVDCHIMLLSNYDSKLSLDEFILRWERIR